MAEATTVMDPASAGQGDEPPTQVSHYSDKWSDGHCLSPDRWSEPAPGIACRRWHHCGACRHGVFVVSQQPERTTLYASLPEAEKARVIDALKNAGC